MLCFKILERKHEGVSTGRDTDDIMLITDNFEEVKETL